MGNWDNTNEAGGARMRCTLLTVALLVVGAGVRAEDKWRWQSNGRATDSRTPPVFRPHNDYVDARPLPHYEVGEHSEGIAPRPIAKPADFRPPNDYRPTIEDRPFRPNTEDADYLDDRDRYPNNRYPNDRYPNRYPAQGNFNGVYGSNGFNQRPGGSYGHTGAINPDSEEVLTGPVPSWQKDPVIKNYDRCKCSSKFNCNSPGISFGQCDVGKQYCCYNSHGNVDGGDHRPIPVRPQHSAANGILVGPGGPIDHPVRRPRPEIEDPGVLVGPGGPTGIIGRPPQLQNPNRRPGLPYPGGPNTQFHSAENGVLVGPGGPFDRPHSRPDRPYGQRPFRGPAPYEYRSVQNDN